MHNLNIPHPQDTRQTGGRLHIAEDKHMPKQHTLNLDALNDVNGAAWQIITALQAVVEGQARIIALLTEIRDNGTGSTDNDGIDIL